MAERRRVVGVDISQAWLDVGSCPEGAGTRLANDPKGHQALLARLFQQPGVDEVACEASTATSGPWLRLCSKAGFRVRVLEAGRVRQFARAGGRRAKTDSIESR